MVDSSAGLIQAHKIVNDEQSIQHDPRKQEKIGKIHKDFEDTMSNFRKRFAMIMSDMKFLVDEEAPRQAIENESINLERKSGDPVIEENLADDLNQISDICAPSASRNPYSLNKVVRHPSPIREDRPSDGDLAIRGNRPILSVTDHKDPNRSKSPI